MISFLKGTVDLRTEQSVILEVNGIGFEIYMSERDLSRLSPDGKEVKVYTYLNVREDAMQLFGFLERNDRRMFRLLIAVSGIGPKGAVNILSAMSSDDLCYAVMGSDAKALLKAPGIGKKTAERILIELRDKLDFQSFLEGNLAGDRAILQEAAHPDDSAKGEAAQALIALGYGSADAAKAVQSVPADPEASAQDILKQALRFLL